MFGIYLFDRTDTTHEAASLARILVGLADGFVSYSRPCQGAPTERTRVAAKFAPKAAGRWLPPRSMHVRMVGTNEAASAKSGA